MDQVVSLTGETKTEAIRHALAERLVRLARRDGLLSRGARIDRFLRAEVWPLLPTEADAKDLW